MLVDFLASQRATLELKCGGLDVELAWRSVEPSTLPLLGLVRHLADVERRWFRQVMAREDAPPRFSTEAYPDEDFDGAVPDRAVIAEAGDAWRTEVAFTDRFVAGSPDLDIVGDDSWRGTVSLRWVLIHMVEEHTRHQRTRRSAPGADRRTKRSVGQRRMMLTSPCRRSRSTLGQARRRRVHKKQNPASSSVAATRMPVSVH
jgi:Protein of unknown function (DUF664)